MTETFDGFHKRNKNPGERVKDIKTDTLIHIKDWLPDYGGATKYARLKDCMVLFFKKNQWEEWQGHWRSVGTDVYYPEFKTSWTEYHRQQKLGIRELEVGATETYRARMSKYSPAVTGKIDRSIVDFNEFVDWLNGTEPRVTSFLVFATEKQKSIDTGEPMPSVESMDESMYESHRVLDAESGDADGATEGFKRAPDPSNSQGVIRYQDDVERLNVHAVHAELLGALGGEENLRAAAESNDLMISEAFLRASDPGGLSDDQLEEHRGYLISAVETFIFGSKIFSISQRLAYAILLTDNDETYGDMIRAPFPSIYLAIPKGAAVGGEQFSIIGAYVRITNIRGTNARRVDLTMIDGVSSAEIKSTILVRDGCRLALGERRAINKNLPEEAQETKICIAQAEKFIFNCILYINSSNSDVVYDDSGKRILEAIRFLTNKKKIKTRAQLARAKGGKYGVYNVGTSIIIDHQIERGEINPTGASWSISTRFPVRGHWRRQACGAGRLEHVTIWIQPFWKGPEFADTIQKDYIVK